MGFFLLPKIRITDKPKNRTFLRNKKDLKSGNELKDVENKLAELCAKDNYDKIIDEIGKIDAEEGGVNSSHLWKLKKKLSPKCRDPPTAMKDHKGNLITSEEAIEALAVETYKKRLENRQINDNLKNLKKIKKNCANKG